MQRYNILLSNVQIGKAIPFYWIVYYALFFTYLPLLCLLQFWLYRIVLREYLLYSCRRR
jgi:hypothetical protein